MRLKGIQGGTLNARWFERLEGRTSVCRPMTIEDWEVVNATLLWINLKAGILPLNGKVLGACEKTRHGRDNDLALKNRRSDSTRRGENLVAADHSAVAALV
jgi:hypothetical protein